MRVKPVANFPAPLLFASWGLSNVAQSAGVSVSARKADNKMEMAIEIQNCR